MTGISDLMKKAQEFQGRMSELQNQLAAEEITGESGGGLVGVTLNGKGELLKLNIDKSLMKPDEVEILEDLVVAAVGEAKVKAERAMQDKMKELTGGMPLPPGMNPF